MRNSFMSINIEYRTLGIFQLEEDHIFNMLYQAKVYLSAYHTIEVELNLVLLPMMKQFILITFKDIICLINSLCLKIN